MAKYTTLTELAAAFESGELNRDHYVVILDKSGCSMHLRKVIDDGQDESAQYDECQAGRSGGGVE